MKLTVDFFCNACGCHTPAIIANVPEGTAPSALLTLVAECHHCDGPLSRHATLEALQRGDDP